MSTALLGLALAAGGVGCGGADGDRDEEEGDTGGESPWEIRPGEGIGPVALGERWSSVQARLGEPTVSTGFGNVFQVTYQELGLELICAGAPHGELGPDAEVIALGALRSGRSFVGPATPGQLRDEIIELAGPPTESVPEVDFYGAGWSVTYGGGEVARSVAVFAPYTLAVDPPEMRGIDE